MQKKDTSNDFMQKINNFADAMRFIFSITRRQWAPEANITWISCSCQYAVKR